MRGSTTTLHFHLSESERGEEIKGRMEKKTYTRRELSDNVCVVCLCRIKFCRLHSSGTRKHSPETTNKQKSAIKGRKQKNKHGTVRKIEIEGGAAVFPSLHLHILSRGVGITAKNFICLFFFLVTKCPMVGFQMVV